MRLDGALPTGRVLLRGDTDFDGFRDAARRLLGVRRAPEDISWTVEGETEPELFGQGASAVFASESLAPLRVSAATLALCQTVALHRDPRRFERLYRWLWRLQQRPELRHDSLDAELVHLRHMAQAVRRDMHKMKAFVRFRELAQGPGEPPLHVAWFEPDHHVVEATAPFFARRFAALRWAVLTPDRCARWDGSSLSFSAGASRADAPPADAGEALWLTYYRSIFNPARLKLKMMEKEMPRRYWPNLPEATLISELTAQAATRSGGMLEAAATTPARKLRARAATVDLDIPEDPPAVPMRLVSASDRAAAWQVQRAAAARCRDCPLGAPATQTVWGEGPLRADLMVVGEQPGDQEDLHGRPFVGPAGQLLQRAFGDLGWKRDDVYLTNAVKHYKYELRGKRRIHKTPAQREADACQHWMESEIALVQPRAIVALGATAARQLLGRDIAVTRERGRWFSRAADGLPVLVTLHPAALLRAHEGDPAEAYQAWLADLRLATPAAADADLENRESG